MQTLTEEQVREWRAIVGDDDVDVRPATLDAWGTATFATDARPRAVVRPESTDEVRACVKLANRQRVAVYPVSSGKNWGFGSAVPTKPGAVTLDLSKMNRIVDFDEEHAHITVEPGVTFQQAHEFLRDRGSKLYVNTTGGSPRSTLVGNVLERGDGGGPYGDRVRWVCGYEVVLPTGELIRTGYARFDGASSSKLFAPGIGPMLDGLFVQSNLGIVTGLTFWLAPQPEVVQLARFSLSDHASLAGVVDALRRLRLERTLDAVVSIWNDYRVFSTRGQYPWELTGGATPLTRERLRAVDPNREVSAWYGAAAMYLPTVEIANAVQERVLEMLRPHVREISITRRYASTGAITHQSGSDAAPDSVAPLGNESAMLDAFTGKPQEMSQKSMYWRKKAPAPDRLDPESDRCGVLWSSIVLPIAGREWVEVASELETLILGHGFEPMLVYLIHQDRAAYLLPMLVYDREVPGEDERARDCHDATLAALAARGHLPYRAGLLSMDGFPPEATDYASVLARLKRTLDPNDVLAPGRYDFRARWPLQNG